MDRCNLFIATTLVAALSIPTIANSALIGRLADTNGNYQAFYDTEADLTWLADANYSDTINYDDYLYGGNTNGLMSWYDASYWVDTLNILGVTDWRMPETDTSCIGYNCINSEMGNLFYNVLGNNAGDLTNTGPFINLVGSGYWSSTEVVDNSNAAWGFSMANNGSQGNYIKSHRWNALVVHDGDVATLSSVPIPPSVFLFLSGLAGLIGLTRKKK